MNSLPNRDQFLYDRAWKRTVKHLNAHVWLDEPSPGDMKPGQDPGISRQSAGGLNQRCQIHIRSDHLDRAFFGIQG